MDQKRLHRWNARWRPIKENGSAFAAYLLLSDTNLAAPDILDSFYNSYADACETFAEFRRDVLEGLGWLQALEKVMSEQAIPDDHLTWNYGAVDKNILDTYDVVHLDGWCTSSTSSSRSFPQISDAKTTSPYIST